MPRPTLVALLTLVAASAHAIPVTTSFTAVGFAPGGAPTDPVSGIITWEAASVTAPIESLTSVSLTIGGHAYVLEELGSLSPFFGTTDVIGGAVSGLFSAMAGTDDFWLMFDRASAMPRQFLYVSAGAGSDFSTMTFASFSITEGTVAARDFAAESFAANTVPEPSTLALFATGLAGLGFGARRRQSTRAPESLTAFA